MARIILQPTAIEGGCRLLNRLIHILSLRLLKMQLQPLFLIMGLVMYY